MGRGGQPRRHPQPGPQVLVLCFEPGYAILEIGHMLSFPRSECALHVSRSLHEEAAGCERKRSVELRFLQLTMSNHSRALTLGGRESSCLRPRLPLALPFVVDPVAASESATAIARESNRSKSAADL